MSHTLLLADDSETTHRVVALIFADRGVRVIGVIDGQQAVERLSAEPPDIVLAGVTLPKVDGYQLAAFMRSQPALRNVPILLTTGAFDTVDEERVRQSGASGVLNKPFESEVVINRVKELLGFGGKAERPVTPPGGRLLTPHDPTPPRPSLTGPRGAGAPPRPAPTQLPPAPARPETPPEPSAVARPEPPASYGGTPPAAARPDAPASDGVPSPPNYGGASPLEPARAQHQQGRWDQLREEHGLGPEAQHVESGSAGGSDDYFDRLDAAFDNLDAQLSGRSATRSRDTAPTTKRMPLASDASDMWTPPAPPPAASDAESGQPVYEVDSGWFKGNAAAPDVTRPEHPASARPDPPATVRHEPAFAHPEPSAFARPAPPASARPEVPPSDDGAPPPSYGVASSANDTPPHHTVPVAAVAPAAPVASASGPVGTPGASAARPVAAIAPPAASFADAFDQLLAAEQGEAPQPADAAHGQAPVIEISDEVIDRIAVRVAERLSEGVLIDTVTHIVREVSERLVREEIARIRSAAQKKP